MNIVFVFFITPLILFLPAWVIDAATGKKWLGILWLVVVLSIGGFLLGRDLIYASKPYGFERALDFADSLGKIHLKKVRLLEGKGNDSDAVLLELQSNSTESITVSVRYRINSGFSLFPSSSISGFHTQTIYGPWDGEIQISWDKVKIYKAGTINLTLTRKDNSEVIFSEDLKVRVE